MTRELQALSGRALEVRMLNNVCATVEVVFWIPDHTLILQTFTWQTNDLLPKFPRVRRFLDFWQNKIDAKIHEVHVSHSPLTDPTELRHAGGLFRLQ